MRLIDADILEDYVKVWEIGCGIDHDQKTFLNAINIQSTIEAIPTAYIKAIIDSFVESLSDTSYCTIGTQDTYDNGYKDGKNTAYMEVIDQLWGLIKGEYKEGK
jgi:hypothetical protein